MQMQAKQSEYMHQSGVSASMAIGTFLGPSGCEWRKTAAPARTKELSIPWPTGEWRKWVAKWEKRQQKLGGGQRLESTNSTNMHSVLILRRPVNWDLNQMREDKRKLLCHWLSSSIAVKNIKVCCHPFS